MNGYFIGQELPKLSIEPDAVAIILANVATLDFFPGCIDPDYARGVGHQTVFMNTMTQLCLMGRLVLEAMPGGRLKSHALTMREPIYAGTKLDIAGRVIRTAPFKGSKLAGPGAEVEVEIEIRNNEEVRTRGQISVIVQA